MLLLVKVEKRFEKNLLFNTKKSGEQHCTKDRHIFRRFVKYFICCGNKIACLTFTKTFNCKSQKKLRERMSFSTKGEAQEQHRTAD